MSERAGASGLRAARLLVLAPTGKDAALVEPVLAARRDRIACPCRDVADARAGELDAQAPARSLLAEEALGGRATAGSRSHDASASRRGPTCRSWC